MSLPTLLKVQKLRAALHAKAKGSPSFSGEANWRKSKRLSSRGPTHGAQAATVVAQNHKGAGSGNTRNPDECLHQKLNLIRLEMGARNFTWAKA
jgi:hypothetical protein